MSRIGTVYGQLLEAARARPEAVALIASGEAWSYQELLARVDGLRRRLVAAGVRPGDRVFLEPGSKRDLVTGMIATVGSGAVAAIAAGGGADARKDADPIVAIASSAGASSELPVVLAQGDSAADGAGLARAAGTDMALLVYTSGTTSARRGVMLTHAILAHTAGYMNSIMGLSADAREYVAAPLDHAFGLGRVRALLAVGGTAVFDDGPLNVARLLLAVHSLGCNALSGTSALFALLLSTAERHFSAVGPALRWIEIGSLPLPVKQKRRLLEIMPNAGVYMNYGLTEAMRSTFLDLRAAPQDKLDSVGRAVPGARLRILDDGEIAITGQHLAPGYWRQPREWTVRCPDGWLRTGDVGEIDDDGYLYFYSRKDDLINVGGEKVSPMVVEEALRELLPQRAYCAFGAPDPDGVLGEVVALCIEGEHAHDARSVRAYLAGRIAEVAVPRIVMSRDALPRTPNGKLQRRVLKESVGAGGQVDKAFDSK